MKWFRRIHQQSRLLMAEMVDTVRQALTLDQQMINGAELMSLEDRILYSAAPMTVDVAQLYVEQEQAQAAAGGESEFVAKGDGSTIRDQDDMFSLLDQVSYWVGQEVVDSPAISIARIEMVFLDESVADYEEILEDLRYRSSQGTQLEIVLIDPSQDGLQQINDRLGSLTAKLDAIHIISHGADRAVKLGNTWYDQQVVQEHEDHFRQWASVLKNDADILFYGCNLASSDDGRAILQSIADWTGADIAASDDLVGNARLGGNWILEYQLGSIQTQVVVSAALQQEWHGLLATFTVTTTADSGAGSLRQAIIDANNLAGADTISFSISSGSQVISLSSILPTITGQVTIDGWSQPGYSSTPLIIIDANGVVGDGLVLTSTADNSIIRGLVIRDFVGDGIQIDAGSDGNTVVGNYIGSFGAGGTDLGASEQNTANGIYVLGANNTIGGTTAATRNVIGGNQSNGIRISGASATNNVVLGNYIGTDRTGVTATANLQNGIQIDTSATGTTIGGTSSGARNIISGNSGSGISNNVANTTIVGNYVGMDVTGLVKVANGSYGIDNGTSATSTMIGGTASGSLNIISGNGNAGILFQVGSSGSVLGNYIGVDATGATSIAGNGAAIFIASNNIKVGGTATGSGNVISGSNVDGIIVSGSVSGNSILGNSIWGNTGLGIDLGDNGVSFNDVLDADSGANALLNFPILKSATTSGTSTTITGNVRGLASTIFRVEFFRTPYGQGDIEGYGEARVFMGATTVTTDSSGNASFSATLTNTSMDAGDLITATATVDTGGGTFGSTSEFAGNIVANESNLFISGSYTGNGVDNRTIAGIGFRPEVVIVMSGNGTAIRTSTMSGDTTKIGGAFTAVTSDILQSLTGDGFTVGTSAYANANGTTYHWVAYGAGDNLDVGRYTGNGTSQTISTIGFQSETAFVFGEGGTQVVFRTNQSANTFDLSNNGAFASAITAIGADSFAVGNSSSTNQSSTAYHYFAFNEATSYFKTGTYTGNGVDNRNITGVGFESEFLITKATSVNSFAIGKTESTGYNTDANVAGAINQLQALQSDGFQVGTDATVNQNGTSYMYLAWRQHDAPLIVDTTSDTSNGTTTSINALRANRGADGRISLREAIAATNATRNVNNTPAQIFFQISGSGNQTITVTGSDLASITGAVMIDASTQSGYANAPRISLVDGDSRSNGLTLASGSDGSTIRGLNIQGFGANGISIVSSNNTIAGNWIGINASGTAAAGNYDGIGISSGDNNIIGGTTATDRNVISGNTNNGLSAGGGADGTQILGNYFGTDKDGLSLVANIAHGIWYGDSTGIVIGGNTSSRRNIVASDGFGIELSNTDNSFIQGNYVGLAVDGSTILGNDWAGIILSNGSSGNLIGTNADSITDLAEANVISGNYVGVLLQGSGTTLNTIAGNLIGTDATGALNRGNTNDGVRAELSAAGNTIGGTATGAGNTIAFSGRDGVRIESTAGIGNAILGNNVYGNTGLGINLVGGTENGFGVTANDSGDGDSGANGLQNLPIITSAGAAANSLRVQGSLNSIASRTFRLEVFASTAADASGHGEGERYLGTFNVTTDGSGNHSFDQTLSNVTVAAGEHVTMTATDLTTNNTSEFAAAVIAVFVNTAPAALATNSTRKGGLTLNAGSGNDSYLLADNGGAIFGGRSQFTIEMQFSLSTANVQHTFLSYAVSGVDNEVYLRTGSDGSLSLSVKGTSVSSSAVNFNTLVGSTNTLTVTWNNATGAWQFFLNGNSFASGTGLQTGATLTSGGSLVLGHDQDSVGGGLQSAQAFKGTLFDTRIFNDIRTATEIASAYQTSLPYNTSGLVANWTFHDLSNAGEIMDSVSGNNLTAYHASGVGFVADDPTLTLVVDENAISGTVVGSLYGTDADREARITALLTADSSLRYSAETGKFYKLVNSVVTWSSAQTSAIATTLSGISGELLTVRSATEQALAQSFAVSMSGAVWLGLSDTASEGVWRWYSGSSADTQAWQGTSTGYTIDGEFSNWLSGEPNDFGGNEDFGELSSTTGKWNDVSSGTTARYIVQWSADDVLDATNAVTYSITSQTVSGAFAINGDSGVLTVGNSSLLNFESQPSHTVTVRVTDGSGATYDKAFTISLSNISVEPTNSFPASPSTNEDTNLVFSAANGNAFTVTDQNGSTNALLQVSLSVPSGTLTLSQTTGLTFPGGSNGSGGMVIVGTESDINAALNGLTFAPVGNFNGNVNLVIETALAADMQGWYTFEGGNANDQSVGTTQNGTFVGNATTVTDATRGTVLTLDGNGDSVSINSTFSNPINVTVGGWVNLNTSSGRAEFISLNDRVHIALDETSGGIKGSIQTGAGSWQDLTSQRFIAGTGWHHVMYVFDDTNNVHNLYIDGQLAATAANANSIYWTGATTSYIGQHPTNSAWNLNGKIDDVRIYSRALSAAEVATIASEQTIDADTVSVTVLAVNDAPLLDNSGNMTLTAITEDETSNVGNSIASIISSAGGDRITDVDSGAAEGIAITATTVGNGTWEYSIDNGSNWLSVGSVANNSALLLRSTDLVRFVPNGQNATSGDITFRAWDQTSGSAGNKVDASTNGTTTAFSTATEVASITVSAVNDAPVLDNTGNMTLTTITEDATTNSGNTVASIISSAGGDRITDVDSGAVEGIAITATTNGNGAWEYSIDNGSNWLSVGSVANNSALLLRSTDLVRFVPNGQNATTVISRSELGTKRAVRRATK